jgi:anhydro-N-acetylmuramic acid kinase
VADALLFAGAGWRALQNIGGIGNVTVVPPAGTASLSGVRAFDTGPGVVVIDAVTRTLMPELAFDCDGSCAARGEPIASVVEQMLKHSYFATTPPKSTGRELFDAAYVETFIAACRAERPAASADDIIATATWLTALSIADAYRRFIPAPVTEILISGGGARNLTLVAMLKRVMNPMPVRQFSDLFFDGDAKEAVAFALLADLYLHHLAGNVPAATGARGPRVLGTYTPA